MSAATAMRDSVVEAKVGMAHLFHRFMTNPATDTNAATRQLEDAVPVFEGHGDHSRLGQAWMLLNSIHYGEGRFEEGDDAIRKAIEHLGRSGDRKREGMSRAFFASRSVWGPTSVVDGIHRCDQVLDWVGADLGNRGRVRRARAVLFAMSDRGDESVADFAESRDIFERLGLLISLAGTLGYQSYAASIVGDPGTAERAARKARRIVEDVGEYSFRLNIVLAMADAVAAQGRGGEAAGWLEAAGPTIQSYELLDRIEWLVVTARVRLAAGRPDEAEAAARRAVASADPTGFLNHRASARLILARALRAQGTVEDAVHAGARARELFEEKGNAPSAREARALTAELVATMP